jgi:4-hydroxyphenylpyruvate dioxygenase
MPGQTNVRSRRFAPLTISHNRATQIVHSVACYQEAGLQHADCAGYHLPSTLENLPQVAVNALPIRVNDYDALLARADENVRINLLKNNRIIHERDGSSGEFPHLYTRPFSAGCFFFELTERRNGYALYDAVNAAVRLSAMQYTW